MSFFVNTTQTILGLELANMVFTSTLVLYPTNLSVKEYGQPSRVQLSFHFATGLGHTFQKSHKH